MAVQRYEIPSGPNFLKDINSDQGKNWLKLVWNKLIKRRTYSQSLAPTAVSANTTSEQTFTVKGLNSTDTIYVNKPTHQAGLGVVNVRVSADNTLAITYMNTTASSITPTTEVYKIVAIESD